MLHHCHFFETRCILCKVLVKIVFKFPEISDNILETVQDRDITMEDIWEIIIDNGLSNSMITDDLE